MRGMSACWRGVAIVIAVATPLPLLGCETPPPAAADPAEAERVRADVDAGLELYASGDYVLAAQRFQSAARGARNCGSLPMERKATSAECTAWLL